MSPENETKNASKEKLKQRMMIVAVVIIGLIVAWQIISMLGGGGSADTSTAPIVVPPAKTMTANAPSSPTTTITTTSATSTQMPSAMSPINSAAGDSSQPKQSLLQENAELIKLQQETQAKYIAALNDLQMLRLKREIAETNQGITTAKLATVTAEKGIADVLTANIGGAGNPRAMAEQSAQAAPPSKEITYNVLSVSFNGSKWTAVLSADGNLYNVSRGDTLTPDGSVVAEIGKQGVILKKDDKEKRLAIYTAIDKGEPGAEAISTMTSSTTSTTMPTMPDAR